MIGRRSGRAVVWAVLAVALAAGAWAEPIRVATDNIRRLTADIAEQPERLWRLREVVERLDADVIALQEIADRAALELVFDPERWHLVIDDDFRPDRDSDLTPIQLAMALRKPLAPVGIEDGDADPKDFLFADRALDHLFPETRDVLAVEVAVPGEEQTLTVLNVHAKSRHGGRAATERQRIEAARLLVDQLGRRYMPKEGEPQPFVLLGDFNDNPDDASMNALETGDPRAGFAVEDEPGAFLVNLTEPLAGEGRVSWIQQTHELAAGRWDPIDPDARERNARSRGGRDIIDSILFDQILVPPAWSRGSCGCRCGCSTSR